MLVFPENIYFVFNSCSRKYANQCIRVYSK